MTMPRSSVSTATCENKPRNAARTFSAIAGLSVAIAFKRLARSRVPNVDDGFGGERRAVHAEHEFQITLALGAGVARQGLEKISLGRVAKGQVLGVGAASKARIDALGDHGCSFARFSAGFSQFDGWIGP
jgi:hypothetical protein